MVRSASVVPDQPSVRTSLIASARQLVHRAADLVVGLRDVGRIEIGAHLAEHVVVAGFLEIGGDDLSVA